MLRLKVDMVDTDKVVKALKKFDEDLQVAMSKFLKTEGADMEAEIKLSMKTGGKQGRIGPRGGKVSTHSLPGQPPYVQTDHLRASVGYMVQMAGNAIFIDVGAIRGGGEVKYAHGLEVGTSNMAARPWLMPVVKKHLDTWEKLMGIKVRAITK